MMGAQPVAGLDREPHLEQEGEVTHRDPGGDEAGQERNEKTPILGLHTLEITPLRYARGNRASIAW